jgi:L-threonylcarbamoyladenylate synthase
MKIVPPTPEGFAEAVDVLFDGGVVAYPTETVYGLAVDPFDEEALDILFRMKGREGGNPVLVVIDDEEDLYDVTAEVDDCAGAYIEAFWPGPLSLLFPRATNLPKRVTAGGPKVCVRCPDCLIARDLCRVFGGALTSTSANLSGKEPARSVEELDLPGLALAIDGGLLPASEPSTIYDPEADRILRPGPISEAALRQVSRLQA